MRRKDLNRLCFILPLLFSLGALGLVASALALGWARPEPDGDEGTAAHLFQLLIVTQMPLIAVFLLTADGRRMAMAGFALQILAIAAALAPVITAGL